MKSLASTGSNSDPHTSRRDPVSIVFSPALVIGASSTFPASHPMVGWRNQVTFENVTADSSAAGYPVTNLGNNSTANRWLSAIDTEQLVTVSDLEGMTDYVGIARHNLVGATISVEAITAEPGADWEVVHPGLVPADIGAIVLWFERGFYIGVRVRILPAGIAPSMAVLFVGESLVLQRGIQPGFTPIVDGNENDLVTGWSQSGEHLGSILDGAMSTNSAAFKAVDSDWYRANMREFVRAGNAGEPFFFAWNPLNHPGEVGYCVFSSGKVQPVINYAGGHYLDISIPMNAVSL